MGFQEDMRDATVTMLAAHASAASVPLNVSSARPRLITPPHAFIDAVRESIEYSGHLMQRTVQVDAVVVWGGFDSEDAAAQKDTFTDGFIDYVRGQVHAAGDSTTVGVSATEDDPTFVPEWLPRDEQRTYYATRITVEGYAEL